MKNYKKLVEAKSRHENLSDERVSLHVGAIKKKNYEFVNEEAKKMGLSVRAYIDVLFDSLRESGQ